MTGSVGLCEALLRQKGLSRILVAGKLGRREKRRINCQVYKALGCVSSCGQIGVRECVFGDANRWWACGTGSDLEMGQQRDKSIGIFVFEE